MVEPRQRIAFISDGRELPMLRDAFDVVTLPFAGAEARLARLECDVVLIDAVGARRFAEVSSISTAVEAGVVIVGPAGEPQDAMRYLDLGAADYVSEHASWDEFIARLGAAARSGRAQDSDAVRLSAGMTVSVRRREVRRDGTPVHLTPHEFAVLEALLRHPGALVSHRDLAISVWGTDLSAERTHLRLYVRQLREKVEDVPEAPSIILTVRGAGYRLGVPCAEVVSDAAVEVSA